jgi:two-component system, OmpR family, alkaline phosphatase synthesis response regulator PhoP
VKKQARTILVVDDDPSFLELLKQYFSLREWNVVAATNAEDGITRFRKHHPEAVILDVNLGAGRDGLSLCDQIRDDISSAETAVILLSADRRGADDQTRGDSVGADAYLLKPVGLTDLEERLEEALKSKKT